jgi:hypothetical protein
MVSATLKFDEFWGIFWDMMDMMDMIQPTSTSTNLGFRYQT